jgi:hypothetical protein
MIDHDGNADQQHIGEASIYGRGAMDKNHRKRLNCHLDEDIDIRNCEKHERNKDCLNGRSNIQVQTQLRRLKADVVRPSVLVKLEDPAFSDKFRVLFEEHIEEFTGNRGTKRPKTEKVCVIAF